MSTSKSSSDHAHLDRTDDTHPQGNAMTPNSTDSSNTDMRFASSLATALREIRPTNASTATLVQRPPPVTLPRVPDDFVPISNLHFRASWARREELAALGDAVEELASFTTYTNCLGQTVPPHDVTMQLFRAAHEWSSLRTELKASIVYCQNQESRAWVQLRALMEQMKNGLEAACRMSPELATRLPALFRLLNAKGAAAARAVAARRANREEIAAGRAPYKGKAGKLRQRKAAEAAAAKEKEGQEG